MGVIGFNVDLKSYANDFLSYRATMGLQNHPHEAYLNEFLLYNANHSSATTCSLDEEAVIEWLTEVSTNGRGGAPQRANVIRLFGKYLESIGETAYILPNRYFPVRSTFSPYILNDAELSKLMDVADNLPRMRTCYLADPYAAKVAPVLFRLIYACGLRPQEGRKLKRDDVLFETGEILIREAKGHKERVVVMSDSMNQLMQRFDHWRNAVSVQSEYFFSRSDGNVFNASWLSNIFRKCWKISNSGIVPLPQVRVYDLRHRFASTVLQKWLNEGRDLNAMLPYLRVYMGHCKMEETACYIHILPESLLQSAGVNWDALDSVVPEEAIWEN